MVRQEMRRMSAVTFRVCFYVGIAVTVDGLFITPFFVFRDDLAHNLFWMLRYFVDKANRPKGLAENERSWQSDCDHLRFADSGHIGFSDVNTCQMN